MGGCRTIRMQFDAPEALLREFRDNLGQGRAFTPEMHPVEPLERVRLVLGTAHAEIELQAEVVMVADQGPVQGVGLALLEVDGEGRARLERFVEGAFVDAAFVDPPGDAEGDDAQEAADDLPCPEEEALEEAHAPARPSRRPSVPVHNRTQTLREMSVPEQIKLARKGELSDRVTLERIVGKPVWEALLRNPRITVAEVARIARKGTVPRPLLELIVDNATWAKTSLVRRALLANPKLSPDMVMRVLKFAPHAELKGMVRNTAYPQSVRSLAKRLAST